MYEALKDYIKDSELRIVNDNFRIRMSPEIAKKYDAGVYNIAIADHAEAINELKQLDVQDIIGKEPIVYVYLVPDDKLQELLMYPYPGTCGGLPVQCFDDDGLKSAFGATQSLFDIKKIPSVLAHVNNIHEYAHLIQNQSGVEKATVFREGFAEVVPWYVLNYEDKWLEHSQDVIGTNLYTANELLTSVSFLDAIPKKRCHFQKSYISSYVLIRTLLEHAQKKYNLTRAEAAKLYLGIYALNPWDRHMLFRGFAKAFDMDAEKLLHTTDYQNEVLKEMVNNVKNKQEIIKAMGSER